MPTQWGSFADPFVQYAANTYAPNLNSLSAERQSYIRDPGNQSGVFRNVMGGFLDNQNVPLAMRQWMKGMEGDLRKKYESQEVGNQNFMPWYEWLRTSNFANDYRQLPAFQRGDKPERSMTSRFIPRF